MSYFTGCKDKAEYVTRYRELVERREKLAWEAGRKIIGYEEDFKYDTINDWREAKEK